jgi:hypothetical protein
MANRNWNELDKAAKATTIAKIALIGVAGVAAVLFTRKAIIDFTNAIIEPLMKDAPETKPEADVQ